ncbi:unnamed protein product [Amaranthus hypochondriacus]
MDEKRFVSWEERIISKEKGNRKVHYYLIDSMGDSVLAVEGTERSIRHMLYVVSEGFINDYASFTNVITATKWRTRREVIDWLSEVVSKQQKSRCDAGIVQLIPYCVRKSNNLLISHSPVMLPRKLKAENTSIVWNGKGWTCSKQLMHYPSLNRAGLIISVHSFVFIMSSEGNRYLGYLEDMYDDKKGQKKVKVRWFYLDQEILSLVSVLDAHPREVFKTPYVQRINAECINGPANVLTPKHYEQCLSILPHSILCRVHFCFRQLKKKEIRPFTVRKLQGYRNQAALSCIKHLSSKKTKDHNFSEGQQGNSPIGNVHKKARKRKRLYEDQKGDVKVRGCSKKMCRAETSPAVLGSEMIKAVSSDRKLKIRIGGRTVELGTNVERHHDVDASTSFKIDDEIELLCQDSGVRGCWFRCMVLETSRKNLKVQYCDLEDADKSGNLQEWVTSSKVAAPDKLGLRCSGRLTTRPRPPKDCGDCILEVGVAVDVWWCDGWWEGVIIATNVCEPDHLLIYSPGENRYLTVEKSHVRTAKDWINGSWVNAKTRPDILSYISATSNSCLNDCVMPTISEVAEAEEDGLDAPVKAKHDYVQIPYKF